MLYQLTDTYWFCVRVLYDQRINAFVPIAMPVPPEQIMAQLDKIN